MLIPKVDEFITRFPNEIRALFTMLQLGKLGGLAVAECDDPDLRLRLFDYFRRRLEAEQVYLLTFELSTKDTNLARSLAELTDEPRFKNLQLTGRYKSVAIFVYGIEKFSEEQRENFVKLLNFLRDRLNMIAHPIIIWGNSAFVTQLSRNASDFWSWKGNFYRFPSADSRLAALPDNGSAPLSRVEQPLPPIRLYLQRVQEDPDYRLWKNLYLPLKAVRADSTIGPLPQRHTLTMNELRQLAPIFPTAETFPANQTIFERGEQGDRAYIIVIGEVEVLIPDALGNDVVITKMGKGDFFGEIALIHTVPRTATVRTTTTTKLLRLTERSLSLLNHKAPNVLDILTEVAQQRLEARKKDILSPLRRFAIEGPGLFA
jgi:CRP-like cAMP-binding protein